MRHPDDKRRRSPVDRFRNILSAEKEQENPPETRKPAVVNLPQVRSPGAASGPEPTAAPASSQAQVGLPGSRFLPTFWTAACILSLIANAVLLIMVVGLMRGLGTLGSGGANPGLLAGLYGSFQQMDQAHIKATIPVQSSLALDASIPVQTTTKITLARDVTVEGAHIKINTALLNIDAPASVTLPSGTSLDVGMDMTLPLQANVPVSMQLPVDIAIQDTDLHPAMMGLEEAIRPLLCASSPNAVTLQGAPICR